MEHDLQLIWETYTEPRYVKMYHGGSKWHHFEAKLNAPKKGRFESGIGINLTTHYDTARRYAKGSRVVSIVLLDPNLKLAEDVAIPFEKVEGFLKSYIGPKNRGNMLDSCKNILKRENKNTVWANYLVNLSVGYGIGGKQGLALTKFIVEHGVDASMYSQSNNEDWLIIHNTEVIKKVIHTKPLDVSVDDYELPRVKEQLT